VFRSISDARRRRYGGLLKQFDARRRASKQQTDSTDHLISRYDAGAAAKMSERHVEIAVRVANVPAEAFESAVESDAPPSVTKRAEPGGM
jgi:hypothetical protein